MKANSAPRIHVTDDTADFLEVIGRDLRAEGYQVSCASSVAETRVTAMKQDFDLFIVDLWCPALSDGLDLVAHLHRLNAQTPILAVSATVHVDDALAALKRGATDFLQKPFPPPRLYVTVAAALERYQMVLKIRHLEDQARRTSGIVGESAEVERMWKEIQRAAAVDWPVLITGESGSGKTAAARAIHQLSARADRPFEVLNCADLNPLLVDDELFGHERGAFTGANERRLGVIDQAANGSLFLDEIGDLPLQVQGRLLQVLETGQYKRLGGEKTLVTNARVMVATHRDLTKQVADGGFREDLLYRLNVLEVRVPPLRERAGDRRLLALYFLEKVRLALGLEQLEFAPEALDHLSRLDYQHNNIRELEHMVRRMALQADGEVVRWLDAKANAEPTANGHTLANAIKEFEANLIRARLAAHGGQISRTAASLGISRVQLWRKMNELALRGEAAAAPEM